MNARLLQSAVDALLNAEVDAGRLGGAAAAVTHRGERVYTTRFGSDRADDIYRIYSMTKPIAAVAALQLYERGALDLWQRVSEYLPAYAHLTVAEAGDARPAREPMTLMHLMDMTSGLSYSNPLGDASERAAAAVDRALDARFLSGGKPSTAEVCEAFAAAPLAFEPGTGYRYGLSADVLGAVIERSSGVRVDAFLRENIFGPLGMRDTGFSVPQEKQGRIAAFYGRGADGVTVQQADPVPVTGLSFAEPAREPAFCSCGAGLYATLDDYAAFAEALLGHGPRILGRKTLEFLRTSRMDARVRAQFSMVNLRGYDYANLVRILRDPALALTNGSAGEFGWDGLPGCYFLVDPAEELTFVYMQQLREGPDWTLRRRLRQAIYAAVE